MKWISGRRRGTVSRCVWDILLSSLLSFTCTCHTFFSTLFPSPPFLNFSDISSSYSIPYPVSISSLSKTHSCQILETTTPSEVILQHTLQEIKNRQHSIVTKWSKAPPCFGSLIVLQSPEARLIRKQRCAAFFLARPHTQINPRRALDRPNRDKATGTDAVTPTNILFIVEQLISILI